MKNTFRIISRIWFIAAFALSLSMFHTTEVRANFELTIIPTADYPYHMYNADIEIAPPATRGGTVTITYTNTRGGCVKQIYLESISSGERTVVSTLPVKKITLPGEDIIFTLGWVAEPAQQRTITFSPGAGATVSPETLQTNINAELKGGYPTPIWRGHVFDGWFFSENDPDDVAIPVGIAFPGDNTLYARWHDAAVSGNYQVTFKVENGAWNDGTVGDKTIDITRYENEDVLYLTSDQIPGVGNNPGSGYKAGSWDVAPTSVDINGNKTLTYTYSKSGPTPPAPTTHTVTYKVVNGKWNDDTTGDKSETVEDNGHLAHIPAVGDKPSSGFKVGSWSPSTPATTVITENKTFTYTYVQNDPTPPSPTPSPTPTPTPTPTPKPRPKDDDHEDSPAPAPLPVNPNAVIGMSFVGTPIGNFKIGPQVQGAAAQFAFRVNMPAGWKEAFSFNMTVNDKADYSLKKGILSFRIPSQYLKAGRKFAILGIDKNGIVKLFADADLKADTITINLDIEGYAFDLIYFD